MKWRAGVEMLAKFLPIVISLAALTISFLTYFESRVNRLPKLDVSPAYDGYFYATRSGIAYHATYDVVNLTSRAVVARSIQGLIAISPQQPGELWINGQRWDFRPYVFEADRSYRIEYLAQRDAGFNRTLDFPGASFECCEFTSMYVGLIGDSFGDEEPIWDLEDLPDRPSSAQSHIISYFSELIKAGHLFSGMSSKDVQVGELDDLRVSFGGGCYEYLLHLPNICAGLEVTLITGETFKSPIKGFGVRSERIIPMIAKTYAEAEA